MSLKAQFKSNYKKRTTINGQPTVITVFVYNVTGNEEDLKDYETAQGTNFKMDDETGKPLFFTTNYVSDNVELTITENNRVVVDDSEFAKIQSMVNNYGESVTRLMLSRQQA